MLKKVLAVATVIAGLINASTASAAILSYQFDHALETTEFAQTGNLGLFDPSFGVLNSVTLTLSGQMSTILTLTNNATQTQTTRATATTDIFFSSSLAGLDGIMAAANPVIALSATTGFQTLASGASVTYGPLLDSRIVIVGSPESFYLGTGTFSISCTSLSGITISGGGGNIASSQATQGACGASIAYDYTARTNRTPEPATLALLGLCAIGAGVARRKFA